MMAIQKQLDPMPALRSLNLEKKELEVSVKGQIPSGEKWKRRLTSVGLRVMVEGGQRIENLVMGIKTKNHN